MFEEIKEEELLEVNGGDYYANGRPYGWFN